MSSAYSEIEQYIMWLSELDPDEVVAELGINTKQLLTELEDYIYDNYGAIRGESNSSKEDDADEDGEAPWD